MPVYLSYASNLSAQAIRLPISTYKFANIYAHTHIYIHIVLVNPIIHHPQNPFFHGLCTLCTVTHPESRSVAALMTLGGRQVSAFLRLVSLEPQSPWCLTNSSTNGKLQGNYGLIFINLVLMMGIYIYVNFNLYHIDHMG
jgi:hypothetical protein